MAQVQFKSLEINKTSPLAVVKRPEDASSWYQAARKSIPDIPQISTEAVVTQQNGLWYLFYFQATEDWVHFELKNGRDERAYVIIDRKKSILQA